MPRISENAAYGALQPALEPAEEMALRLKAELEGAEQFAAMQRQELAEHQRHAEREIEVAERMARAARAALHELETSLAGDEQTSWR